MGRGGEAQLHRRGHEGIDVKRVEEAGRQPRGQRDAQRLRLARPDQAVVAAAGAEEGLHQLTEQVQGDRQRPEQEPRIEVNPEDKERQ